MQKLNKYDIIYGTIADDRMDEAMKRFMQNGGDVYLIEIIKS